MVADIRLDTGPQHRHALLQRAPAQVGLLGRDPLWQDGQLVHQPGRSSDELLGLEIEFDNEFSMLLSAWISAWSKVA